MQTSVEVPSNKRSTAITLNRMAYWVCSHWMAFFTAIYGLYVGVPFLAPVFMAMGLTPLGKIIYSIYSFLCHQLPERSLFLFGPKIMVPLAEIQANWKVTDNPLILRQFVGNPALGWKVAWSDRMVYMFTSILFLAWIWWFFRLRASRSDPRRIPKLSWKAMVLFLLPMALDGGTHFLSDLSGHHQSFRDTNAWLAALTQHVLSLAFYAGDAWGSFNSLMRMLTGILFGIGIVWFGFPYLEEYFKDQAAWIRYKFERARLPL